MPRGRPKNPENHTPREEIALVLQWAEQSGYADIPAIMALRTDPTAQHIHDAIQWAEQLEFYRIAAALRNHALPQ